MGKLKVGDKVIVKGSGEKCLVVSRDYVKNEEKGTSSLVYMLRNENEPVYHSSVRSGLVKIKNETQSPKTSEKTYTYYSLGKDKRVIMLTGVVNKIKKPQIAAAENGVEIINSKVKSLSVGYSICHSSDVFDENTGKQLAVRRAKSKPIAYLETPFTGDFRADFVGDILKSKWNFINNNIEKFIDRDKTFK